MDHLLELLIIGGGLSGLSAARFAKGLSPAPNPVILEASPRLGGAVRSYREGGYLGEYGPHGFLDNGEATQELLEDLELLPLVRKAPLGEFKRFICWKGKLRALPQSPLEVIRTGLLSPGEKFRVLGELWVKPEEADQSAAAWAARRFGKALLPFVDAALTGTYAGDMEKLSINSIMPGLRALEIEYQSVFKGLKHKPKGKGLPRMISFPQGVETLTQALARGVDARLETKATGLRREGEAWRVETDQGGFLAKRVLLALPVRASLELLRDFSPPTVENAEAGLVNLLMAFEESFPLPYGFGYLAPEREGRFCLGAMFSSQMFPERAPGKTHLVEVLIGGRRHPERLRLSDEELIAGALADLGELLEMRHPPLWTKVLRPEAGIPQPELGHPSLLAWKRSLEAENSGLYVSGFGWEGIGINDVTKKAKEAVMRMFSAGEESAAEVKGVYF